MPVKIEPRDVKVVGSASVVTVDSSGRALTVVTPPVPAVGGALTLAAIDPAVVERLAAQAAAAAHKTLTDVAYVAVSPNPLGGRPQLGVYMTDLTYYSAAIDGTGFTAHGGGTATSTTTASGSAYGVPAGGSTTGAAATGSTTGVIDPQKIAACVQRAGTDAAKIAACTGHDGGHGGASPGMCARRRSPRRTRRARRTSAWSRSGPDGPTA